MRLEDRILQSVCDYYGVTLEHIRGPHNCALYMHARRMAMFLLKEDTNLTLYKVGELVDRSYDTVTFGHHTILGMRAKLEKDLRLIRVRYQ